MPEQKVATVLARLPGMDAEILRWRFGLEGETPCTLRELGEEHSLSRERIRQLQPRAINSIRLALRFTGVTEGMANSA